MAASLCWAFIALSMTVGTFNQATPATPEVEPLYGFTAFPYDLTLKALDRVNEVIEPASNLYAIHMDGPCVPWQEALTDTAFPAWIEEDWTEILSRVPADRPIYIAVTPTKVDRVTLAEPCGPDKNTPGELPSMFAEAGFDDDVVVGAYIAYVTRVLEFFQPGFVNLSIEISEMSLVAPDIWPQFESLYLQTLAELRESYPATKFGLEVVLQSLLLPRVADQVKPAVEASDYLGISFYPYGSEYGEAQGTPALGPPPEQWQAPLDFVRAWTDKPLAMCETGYTTRNITLPLSEEFNLHFNGDEATQTAFTRDLVTTALLDNYLFVVWFVPIDYPALMEALSSPPGDPGWIWTYSGLWSDPDHPKPALEEWLKLGR